MPFAVSALILLAATAACAKPIAPRGITVKQSNVTYVSVSTYDGVCFYPTPDSHFGDTNMIHFLGRWYQMAATVVPPEENCTCVHSDLDQNTQDNTLSIKTSCQKDGKVSFVHGTAKPVAPAYGAAGTFQLRLDSAPDSSVHCPGPNYIVQKFDPDAGWALVQTSSFASMILLSRKQVRSDNEIQPWLDTANKLGANLAAVAKTVQESCVA